MRVLVLSWVFPNHAQPVHGPFVLARMKALAAHADLTVIAPVPWVPLGHRLQPATRPQVASFEEMEGLPVYHPRFFRPSSGYGPLDAAFYYLSVRRLAKRLDREARFDLIDAHFVYPDGRAATLLGRELDRPVVITLRGVLGISRTRPRVRAIRRGLHAADAILSVSGSLRDRAVRLGISPDRITIASNGVDASRFSPLPRDEARARLGLDPGRRVLISVGHLGPRKGFHRVIELLPELIERVPDLLYVIVGGDTYERSRKRWLSELADRLGVGDRVRLVGARPNHEVRDWLSAADVFVLLTSGEGWANVLMEALACGLPVIATDVGGNAEIIASPELGWIVPPGDRRAALDRLTEAFANEWDRDVIRAHALEHSWERTAQTVAEVWRAVTGSGR